MGHQFASASGSIVAQRLAAQPRAALAMLSLDCPREEGRRESFTLDGAADSEPMDERGIGSWRIRPELQIGQLKLDGSDRLRGVRQVEQPVDHILRDPR
jgi:hypothetical protein